MKRPKAPKFPEDDVYRRQLLTDAGLPPDAHARIRSIAGPAEIRAIVCAFQKRAAFYQPGIRPRERRREVDSHGLENVASRQFRANLHIHTRHSDGRLSIPQLLRQASLYADSTAEMLQEDSPAPFAPFTIGIMDHNRVEGCAEAIRLIFESPRRYRNLRVILGSEVTVRLQNIYEHQLREKRHAGSPGDPGFFPPFRQRSAPEPRSCPPRTVRDSQPSRTDAPDSAVWFPFHGASFTDPASEISLPAGPKNGSHAPIHPSLP